MNRSSNLPIPNFEFAGLSDAISLSHELTGLRTQLELNVGQLIVERKLAVDIHRARSSAIHGSEALKLVFDIDGLDEQEEPERDEGSRIKTGSILSAAFLTETPDQVLTDEELRNISKRMRIAAHPDKGGDDKTAKDIGEIGEMADIDPELFLAKALLFKRNPSVLDEQTLRDERHLAWLALKNQSPRFETTDEAEAKATLEIEGAEWRVRTEAAVRTFELIIGDNEVWKSFLEDIIEQRNIMLISMVNEFIPRIRTSLERMEKGDPISAEHLDISGIDAMLEKVWTTIGESGDRIVPYSPPYQNWLSIVLPMFELLDPGKKPGIQYTHFKPPIRVSNPAPTYSSSSYKDRIEYTDSNMRYKHF